MSTPTTTTTTNQSLTEKLDQLTAQARQIVAEFLKDKPAATIDEVFNFALTQVGIDPTTHHQTRKNQARVDRLSSLNDPTYCVATMQPVYVQAATSAYRAVERAYNHQN